MKKKAFAAVGVLAVVTLSACAPVAEDAEPTRTPYAPFTASPAPTPDDEWQRFRDDPKQAFVFASAYEIIWGTPIGSGENADTMVGLAFDLCNAIESGANDSWEAMVQDLGGDESADKAVLTAQVYCPEID